MRQSAAIDPGARPRPAWGRLWPELPSWLISAVLHALLFLALALTLRLAPRQGLSVERTAEVGIALKHQEGDRQYYESGPDAGGGASAAANGNRADAPGLSDLLADESPVDPTPSLPAAMNLIGRDVLGSGGLPSASGLSQGPSGRGASIGGKGRASLFGITAEGWKFAYVLDRSDSMNWYNQRPLRAAKRELIASLESLGKVHRFLIVFYNEEPKVFNPSGQRNKLAFATEQNKRNARKFIQGIVAGGGTDHAVALLEAIKLQPDVIFLLTDADDPPAAGQLYEIQRSAAETTIHAVEFGLGPQRDPNNFLVRLARGTGGKHVFVDISKLP